MLDMEQGYGWMFALYSLLRCNTAHVRLQWDSFGLAFYAILFLHHLQKA
jgi:hypothetical protein